MKLKFAIAVIAALAAQNILAATTRPLTCPLISELKNAAVKMTAKPCQHEGRWCGSIDELSFGKNKWSLHVTSLSAIDEADAVAKSIATVDGIVQHMGPGQDNTGVWFCEYFTQDDGAVFLVTPPQKIDDIKKS